MTESEYGVLVGEVFLTRTYAVPACSKGRETKQASDSTSWRAQVGSLGHVAVPFDAGGVSLIATKYLPGAHSPAGRNG